MQNTLIIHISLLFGIQNLGIYVQNQKEIISGMKMPTPATCPTDAV